MQLLKFIYYLEFLSKIKETKLCSLQGIKIFSPSEVGICKLGEQKKRKISLLNYLSMILKLS